MIKQHNLWRNVRDLLLRYIMICVFVFMCVILIANNPGIFGPIFGVFYFIALIYYFWFTLKTEGELDVNRVKIGQMPRFRWKGAVCALILAIPLMIINIVPNFFPDPTPVEYQAYFSGEATVLTEESNFNKTLKEVSGKGGYVSEIVFLEDETITKITYVTSDGQTVVCDGTVQDQDKLYALYSEEGADPVYYTDDAQLTEAQIAAFEECKNAIDDIGTVMGEYPHWQVIVSAIKAIFAIALQYFCAIFAGSNNAVLSTVVYCACMLVLCIAAQVGYEMGYRNISLLRSIKPKRDNKAGDSVVIQRGRSVSDEEQ